MPLILLQVILWLDLILKGFSNLKVSLSCPENFYCSVNYRVIWKKYLLTPKYWVFYEASVIWGLIYFF